MTTQAKTRHERLDCSAAIPVRDDPASADAFLSSGPSPTLHLLGAGKVACALLGELTSPQLIGVSDSRTTLFDRGGLHARAIAETKRASGRLARPESSTTRARAIDSALAVDLVDAELVADCGPTRLEHAEGDVQRSLRILDLGRSIAFAAKTSLLEAPLELLREDRVERVGFSAVLGGCGSALKRELAELRKDCRGATLVPNASTTRVVEAIEEGAGLENALTAARRDGLLEHDAQQDLTGVDAAIKLVIVASLLSGTRRRLDEVELPRAIDVAQVRRSARRGATTRLVGDLLPGGRLRVAWRELPRASTLAPPSTRVAYAFELGGGVRRVLVGAALGPVGTARAVLADLADLSRRLAPQFAERGELGRAS